MKAIDSWKLYAKLKMAQMEAEWKQNEVPYYGCGRVYYRSTCRHNLVSCKIIPENSKEPRTCKIDVDNYYKETRVSMPR